VRQGRAHDQAHQGHFPGSFLIGGNIATADAARDLESWGCDAIKAGIAGGRVCITKNKTGFHRPMISTVRDCVSAVSVPVIADGGIVEHGDMAKALACGASMIMAGSLFAGYDESAGEIVEINGKHYKEYFGSASQFNKGASMWKARRSWWNTRAASANCCVN
jgi:GMP reductase